MVWFFRSDLFNCHKFLLEGGQEPNSCSAAEKIKRKKIRIYKIERESGDINQMEFYLETGKPQMNPYCYPHYNNMPPGNSSMSPHPGGPGDYCGPHGPHGPPMMGGYPPPPSQGPTLRKEQPSTLEAQYMQQQSQIFVFSTQLANKGADAVFSGNYPSIIAFHTSHPATRKFLEVTVSELFN